MAGLLQLSLLPFAGVTGAGPEAGGVLLVRS